MTTNNITESISEANKKWKNDHVYMLLTPGEMVISSTKYGIEEHLKSPEAIATPNDNFDGDEVTLLFGMLLDPADLPFTIDESVLEDNQIWLVIDDDVQNLPQRFDDLEDVTEEIEFTLNTQKNIDIYDVCVLIGQSIELALTPLTTGKRITMQN